MKLKSVHLLYLILVFSFFFPFSLTKAATLNISSASKKYDIGDTVNLSILVSTDKNEPINAVAGTILFPKNLVEVTSISKTDTIVNFWVTEPSFSNTQGTISFEGIITNPGFTGTSGKIIKISLKTKQKGNVPLTLSNASVLANDGNGTNVLENIGQIAFTIGDEKVEIPPPVETLIPTKIISPQKTTLPGLPVLTSDNVPDQTIWYMTDNIKVNWELPENISKVYASIDKNEKAIPKTLKTGSQISFERTDLASGVWYVHVRFKNNAGYGPTASFKINIDTTSPNSFDISEAKSTDDTKATFNIVSTDALSGIDKYSFIIDSGETEDWIDDGSHIFTTKVLAPGTHTISGIVYDKAGNKTTSNLNFTTEGVPTPQITLAPESFKENEQYKIEGIAFPKSKIKVFVDNADGKRMNDAILETTTEEDGNFIATGEGGLPYGTYNAYAKSYINDVSSPYSNQVPIISKPTGFHLAISILKEGLNWILSEIIKYLMLIIGILALIILLILVIAILKYRKNHPKIKSIPSSPSPSVDFGRKNNTPLINHAINTQLAILEKINTGKNFSTEERHFLSQLHRDLDYIDTKDQQ